MRDWRISHLSFWLPPPKVQVVCVKWYIHNRDNGEKKSAILHFEWLVFNASILLLGADERNNVFRERGYSSFNVIDQFSTSVLRELDLIFLLKDQKNPYNPRPGPPWKESWIRVTSPFARINTLHASMKDSDVNVNSADMQQAPIAWLVFDHGVMISTIPDVVLAYKYLVHPCLGGKIISWTQDYCPFVSSCKES